MLLLNTRRASAPAVVLRLPCLKVQNILQSFAQVTKSRPVKRKTREVFVGPSENKRFGVSDLGKKKGTRKKNIGPRMRLCVMLVEPYPQLLGYTAFKSRLN